MHCAEISGYLKSASKVGQLPRFLLGNFNQSGDSKIFHTNQGIDVGKPS